MRHARFLVLLLLSTGLVAWGLRGYYATSWAPASRLSVLMADPKMGEAVGVIHGQVRVTGLEGGRRPCAVSYRRNKTDHVVTVQSGAVLAMADGRTFEVAPTTGLEFFSSYRPDDFPSAEETFTIQTELGINDSHRPEITCAGPAEPMYVVGCRHPGGLNELVPCADDDRVLLAPGKGPTPYVASYAANGAAWLGLALFGVLFGSFTIWSKLSFLRPVVRDLSAHARATARSVESSDRFGLIFAGTLVAAAIVFLAIRGRSGLYLVTMGVVVLASGFVYILIGVRYRMLDAALKIVRGMSTGKLADPGDEVRELLVRVARDAPLVDPISGTHKPAFVRARIIEVLRVPDSKGNKVEVSKERATLSYPRWLPIEDETAATLDMEGCRIDTAPQPSVTMTGGLRLPPWASEVLDKPIQPAEHHKEFLVHWGKLDPGDSLLLYGQVGRMRPGDGEVRAHGGGGYRSAPVALAVQGKAVVYHGEESELEPAISRERFAALSLALALVTAIVATVAASIHAATLV